MLTFFSKSEDQLRTSPRDSQDLAPLQRPQTRPIRSANIVRLIESERAIFNHNQPKEHWATHLIMGERRYRELCAYLQAMQRITLGRCDPVRPTLYEGLKIILCEDPDRVDFGTAL